MVLCSDLLHHVKVCAAALHEQPGVAEQKVVIPEGRKLGVNHKTPSEPPSAAPGETGGWGLLATHSLMAVSLTAVCSSTACPSSSTTTTVILLAFLSQNPGGGMVYR